MAYQLREINDAIRSDPAAFLAECDAAYQRRVGAAVDAMFLDKDAVQYDANGNATLDYQNC